MQICTMKTTALFAAIFSNSRLPMKQTSLIILFLVTALQVTAGSIRGHVTDVATGEPVIGAMVILNEGKAREVSGLDGSYRFINLSAGTYTIQVSYVSFNPVTRTIQLTDVSADIAADISLGANNNTALQAVTVSAGKDGAGEQTARNMERNADQVMTETWTYAWQG